MQSFPRCSHCGAVTAPWLNMPVDPMRRQNTPFGNVRRCVSCYLGMAWPMPAASDVPAFYDIPDYYTHGERKDSVRQSVPDRILGKLAWLVDRSEMFDPAKLVRDTQGTARVIDIGCGDANFLRQLVPLGHYVVGVDPDPQARSEAARHGVEVLAGTAEELPESLKGETFDFIIMTHVLEHCINPAVALRNCFDLLASGGTLYCEVPNCACDHFKTFTVCSTMFDAPRHLHFFQPATLRSLLVRHGFEPGKELYWGFSRQHSNEWRSWERDIAAQLRESDGSRRPVVHTLLQSLTLLARSGLAGRERKYDSFGILALKPRPPTAH